MTNLTRYTPQRTLGTLQNEVDRLFGRFFPLKDERLTEQEETGSYVWAPRVDLAETEDEFVLQFDLPGISRENVAVRVEEHTLIVDGEREMSEEEKDRHYRRIERSYGQFYRAFDLGESVDADRITARHADGVLTVQVPKTEKSKPRRIEIS